MSDSEDLGLGSPVHEPSSPEERRRREGRATIKQFPPSHTSDEVLISRIPAFLNIEPHPFDSTAEPQLPVNPNTIRWKYAKGASGAMDKLSNARIIEWDDGSRTLQLGAEQFELRSQNAEEPVFVTFTNNELLSTASLVDKTITVVPTSTASATHTRLAKQLADKVQGSQVTIKAHATTDDPEQMQREYEKAEQAKEKARRKLEQKREQEEETQTRSYARSEEELPEDSEEEAEESEEEDSDEDRANRLQAIKRGNDDSDDDQPSRRRKMVDDDSD